MAMKKIFLILGAVLAVSSAIPKVVAQEQPVDYKIAELISAGDYFGLSREYRERGGEIQTPMVRLFSEALLAVSENRPEEAVMLIDSLVEGHSEELGRDVAVYLLSLKETTLYMAAQVADVARGMRREARDEVVPVYIEELKRKGETVGHRFNIDARFNGNTRRVILDTGAPCGAFVTEKFAAENGIELSDEEISVTGAGEGTGRTGFIKELALGGITFRNVPVIVVPEIVPENDITQIDALIGSVVLAAIGEMTIYPARGEIVFPLVATPLPATGRNMITMGGQFYFEAMYGGDPLALQFDTGCADSNLYETFYEKYKRMVRRQGKRERKTSGGFGGVMKETVYKLPSFAVSVAGREVAMDGIPVSMVKTMMYQGSEDGVFGMSFVRACDKITVNFRDMFIAVE